MCISDGAWIEQRVEHSAARMHHRPDWLTSDNVHFMTWLIAVPVLNLLIWALALKTANTLAHLRRNHLVELMRKHGELAQSMEDLSLWGAVRALPENLKEVPGEVRDAALAEIARVRQVGGQIDRGLERALARQAARIRAKRGTADQSAEAV